jgi:tetratricopeptide (TPR) repeat protein
MGKYRPRSSRSTTRRPSYRRHLSRLRKPEMIFALLALLVVCSLVTAALGTVVVDQLTQGSGDDQDSISNTTDETEQSFRDAAAANPNDPDALKALANYLAQTGNLAEAITWYEKALTINPNDAVTRLAFADALAGGSKRADAEIQYKKVFEIQPSNPQAHFGLAQLYRGWSPPRTNDAIVEYNKTIEVGPGSYVAELATQMLASLTPGTPSPVASPATPEGAAAP